MEYDALMAFLSKKSAEEQAHHEDRRPALYAPSPKPVKPVKTPLAEEVGSATLDFDIPF
jgi:hypothetical protein